MYSGNDCAEHTEGEIEMHCKQGNFEMFDPFGEQKGAYFVKWSFVKYDTLSTV